MSYHSRIVGIAIELTCLVASPASASSDAQAWQTVTLNHDVSDSFRLSIETTVRSRETRAAFDIETAIMAGYRPSKKVTIAFGYVFDPTFVKSPVRVTEHRFREQISFDNVLQIGKARIGGRLRFEQRWRNGFTGTAWRFRPQVRMSMPIAPKLTLVLSHESFIDLNTTAFEPVAGYERMRNAVSFNTPLNSHINMDLGYINQHVFVPDRTDTTNHVFTLGLTANF
jgi:hypothetical protein